MLFLLALLVGKIVACSLTIGIGGSGGVFAPSLFCGAMVGAVFGDVVHAVAPASGGSVGAYALVGMGAVFAGAARAPITAVVIMFELTGEYTIILPLMLAIVLATGISHVVSRDTVYTRKLLRRGIDIDAPAEPAFGRRPVSAIMAEPPEPIAADSALSAIAERFSRSELIALPVVDADRRLLGVLSAHEVMDAAAAGEDSDAVALTRPLDALLATESVGMAIKRLDRGDTAVPVADESGVLVGWITQRDVLGALSAIDTTEPDRG